MSQEELEHSTINNAKLDKVIEILESMENYHPEFVDYYKRYRIIELINREVSSITTNSLFLRFYLKTFHSIANSAVAATNPFGNIYLEHKNGWIFTLHKFLATPTNNDIFHRNGHISMSVSLSEKILLSRCNINIDINIDGMEKQKQLEIQSYSFADKINKDGIFWKYSKLDYIDFDNCYTLELKHFLIWCDKHRSEEILDLV